MCTRNLKLGALVLVACASFALSLKASAQDKRQARIAPAPTDQFSPSNARTEGGSLIPESQFFRAKRCASCHEDTHAGWSQSLHRNSGREPFYKESVDILLRSRGIEFTRHCESCHAPVSLLSGALAIGSLEPRELDDEGVTCSVCHSITEARLDGTGSYTIRRPALLAREDGTPIPGDPPDQQILADIPSHRRAVMRPLLKQPEFCATCHKSSAPPELNGYKFIRGFSAYDEWQQSGVSHETLTPFYRRPARADCRACHMPRIESGNDLAAKGGKIASHRWPGANTAAPLFYGQIEQVALTENFLKADVVNIDIFAVKNGTTGETFAPLVLAHENRIVFEPGQELTAEVVISNRNAAHSFPPELRDLYEAWVEFEAFDASGKTILHSGFLNQDATLDASAHVYRQILLEESGRMITRHQVWLASVKAYDNAIAAGRSDVVRFRFLVPVGVKPSGSITLRARVNYRRFNQEYTGYVLGKQKAQMTVPVVQMAEAWIKIAAERRPVTGKRSSALEARRWNDYAIGLLEQSQYGQAAEAFRQASKLEPTDLNLVVNAAIAEMKTEQYGTFREQLSKAATLLDGALGIDPAHTRARFYRAVVSRAEGKAQDAAHELQNLATLYPRDREVLRQLGQTYYVLGQIKDARARFEALLEIDPTDAGAYQFLSTLYASEGQMGEADCARSLYLKWRDDPLADTIGARFFAAHPEWSEERVSFHSHGKSTPRRLILTGKFAAPDK